MGLATWWTRSEIPDWNIGFRLGLTILIGVIAHLGWLEPSIASGRLSA